MPPIFIPGTIVALRYQIIEPLGAGGMAQVYRARHLTLRREVAIKVMNAGDSNVSEARFAREARNAASLDHPGCVRVVDYGSAIDGTRFLVMNLVRGTTLRRAIRGGPAFEVERAVAVVDALLSALEHAHGRGVLHRDVKPGNVMLGDDGRVVLIDFGLSAMESDAPLTALGTCVGSPAYLSPERLLGQPYDHRADLYAVGLVLYEMLTGQRAFDERTPLATARAQIHCEPRPIGLLRPSTPRSLMRFVDAAIAKRPEDRFTSAGHMRAALADAVNRARQAADAMQRAGESVPMALMEMAAATTAFPARARPSRLARLWSWLRFGRWRWRDTGETSSGTVVGDLRL